MSNAKILVVLPTLGERLDSLAETLSAVDAQRADVDLTLVVVMPTGAVAARELVAGFAAVIVDDPKEGIGEHPEAVLAYGGCEYIDPAGKVLALSNAGVLAKFLLPWGPDLIPHPGTMIRLDALEAIGGFDVRLKYAMDLDAFLKLRAHGSFVCTRTAVSAFRWHPDSLTVANRLNSSRESESVKTRHLVPLLRPISPLWNYPIRWASSFAARRVSAQAK